MLRVVILQANKQVIMKLDSTKQAKMDRKGL